ncbi:MAG: Hsp20/alpha crystallin family protein [Patescibacteria group bacterium]|nr:Hsp20/alpha crystallin family protein [Patescibacteria group bacterium]MDD5173000.1 Hsp20/alpha crystallin family protein [Patescibacteria group bacterium]
MTLVPFRHGWFWEPNDIDKFFDEWPQMKSADFMPAVNVYEKDNKVMVEAVVTGFDPKKVEISVQDNALILKGENQKKSEVEEKNYYYHEVKSGSFYRAITLPVKVAGEKTQAVYQDGILKIEIPKAKEIKSKKVQVKVVNKK